MNLKHLFRSAFDFTGNMLRSPPRTGFGYFRNRGSRDQRRIALTFDNGPNAPSTERLLDLMGNLGVKGTFFCVGINTVWNPEIVARAYAEGHTIGNHYAKNWEKPGTIEAIHQIVPALRAEGYEFVTIPEMFNIPAYAPLVNQAVAIQG